MPEFQIYFMPESQIYFSLFWKFFYKMFFTFINKIYDFIDLLSALSVLWSWSSHIQYGMGPFGIGQIVSIKFTRWLFYINGFSGPRNHKTSQLYDQIIVSHKKKNVEKYKWTEKNMIYICNLCFLILNLGLKMLRY